MIDEQFLDIPFQLEDILSKNQAKINCQKGTILFISSTQHKVSIQEKLGKKPLKVVKSNKFFKGL